MAKRTYSTAKAEASRQDAPHPNTRYQGRRGFDGQLETDVPVFPLDSVWDETIPSSDSKHPAVGLINDEENNTVSAWFGYNLVSVVSEKATNDRKPVYPAVPGLFAFSEMLASLTPEERLYFVITCENTSRQGFQLRYELIGCTRAQRLNTAVSQTQILVDNLNVVFAFLKTTHLFAPLDEPPTRLRTLDNQAYRYRLDPVSLRIGQMNKAIVGFTGSKDCEPAASESRLPLPVDPSFPFSLQIVPALLACHQPLTMAIELQSKALTDEELTKLSAGLDALSHGAPPDVQITLDQDAPGVLANETREKLAKQLECWLHRGKGYTCRCFVFADVPVPSTALSLAGSDLFGGRSVLITESLANSASVATKAERKDGSEQSQRGAAMHDLDLSRAYHATQLPPILLPKPDTLLDLGFPQHYDVPALGFAVQGIVLGDTRDQQEVRFAESDRTRHCYVMGATGTGKSTLLYNMIVQDMTAGRGVGLFDPHGDLFRQVLDAVPARRIKDVILINPADAQYSAAVNFFEIDNQDPIRERAFVTNELIQIISRLFRADTMGPGFEGMLRNAVALLLGSPAASGYPYTLVDFPRVFEDQEFREYLIAKCNDPIVTQFWTGNVVRMTGEQSLKHWAWYVVSKIGPFIYNASIRRIIGQKKSTINFRKALDSGSILLVNLPKGEIGDLDTAFLGMLFMGKILGAALSRAKLTKNKRRPFHLYVDEFQNFTTDSVATLLAEARKYGLHLTFANQNMAQLPLVLLETVLGNVGTKFYMRCGMNDAPIIEPSLTPYLSRQDIMSLPDYHVVGRMLINNMPSKPLVFKTRTPIPPAYRGNALQAHVNEIVAHSRACYARPVGEVDEAIRKAMMT
jgi:hypothetical protein